MNNCSPVGTLIIAKDALFPRDNEYVETCTLRSIVGTMKYLTFTSLDIVYAANKVYQHLHSHTFGHFWSIKRILRYLKGTQHLSIRYLLYSSISLYGFSYSDWLFTPRLDATL